MTYKVKNAAALLVPVLLSAMLIGCAAKKPSDKDAKLSIVCTNFSEYDWTREIIGETDSANVTYLLESGMDIHNYQPSAQDIMTISDCDMFIYVGGESESWVDDALSTKTNKNMKVVKLFEAVNDNIMLEEHKEGMEEEEEHYHDDDEPEYDEHVWLSVRNAELICNDICNKLCELDSANSDTYKANLAAYTDKLRELDGEYKEMAENAKIKTLLFGDRFPFRYLVEDYGLDYYAAFKGCSAETEASFETIAKLAEKLDELQLDNVFIIENSSDAIAKSIISSSDNKKAKIEKLNSLQSVTSDDIKKGATYISLMKNDLETLKKVLD
ncbi:metal ABC transporter substrate-binding protein [Ruminococcus sp.]|uniref:metal ABC transporter substrate-binding protein n=1 Tax=Ruminococcus sp. TaxID=41978 RepID=UPI0025E0B41F|nr:metal ABC transporter substrate-binding protein [Ruminococcus sp.]